MVGFDIGGTKCAVCVGEETNGELIIKDKRITAKQKSLKKVGIHLK